MWQETLVFVIVGLAFLWVVTHVLMPQSGAILGGLAGSVYVSGLNATAAMVAGAATATADAIATTVPAVATGVTGAIAGASTPVLVGVVVGGALGYWLLN